MKICQTKVIDHKYQNMGPNPAVKTCGKEINKEPKLLFVLIIFLYCLTFENYN